MNRLKSDLEAKNTQKEDKREDRFILCVVIPRLSL